MRLCGRARAVRASGERGPSRQHREDLRAARQSVCTEIESTIKDAGPGKGNCLLSEGAVWMRDSLETPFDEIIIILLRTLLKR